MKKFLAILLAGIVALSAMSITVFATDKVLYESTTGTTLTETGDYALPWDGFGIGNTVNDKTIGDITWDEFVKIAKAGGAQLVINFKATPWGAGDAAMKSQFNCWDDDLQVTPEWTTLSDGTYQTVLDIDDCVDVLEANGGSLDNAKNFGVQLCVMDCTIYSVKLIIPETDTVTLFEANFSDDNLSGWGWQGATSVNNGHLYFFNRWNAHSRIAYQIGILNKDVEYTVSVDVYVDPADTTADSADGLDISAFLFDSSEELFGDKEYNRETKTVVPGTWTNITFTYTPTEDLTNVGLALNAGKHNPWTDATAFYVDNIKVTYKSTEVEPEKPNTPENPEEPTTVVTNTGYFSTGDDTHAIIIGDAIITSNHVLDANGNCVYCGYHKDVAEEEIVVEVPVEAGGEEVDTDDVDNNEDETVDVEDKTEDTNPTTGIALAVVPMMVAAALVVASKRR